MKKLIPLFVLVLLSASCKKTWQCECSHVQNYEDWNAAKTSFAIEDEKEDDAETICASQTIDAGNGNYTSCKLKK